MTDARACPVCGARMRGPVGGFRYDCAACGFAQGALPVAIGATSVIAEDVRASALAPLRRRTFDVVLDRLAAALGRSDGALLEAGCAHGWFLDAARARGFAVHGIEPDAPIAAEALARGHDVARGYFPAAAPADAQYDAIVFNDVFEHLPDPAAALQAAHARLRDGGVLAINLPSSRGTVYRTAKLLRALGWSGPHDRMWQRGFPSPHLSYFHPDALARLARAHGFTEIERRPLPALAREGLWARLRYDRRAGVIVAGLTWLALRTALPLLRALPSDSVLQLFARAPAPQRAAAEPAASGSTSSCATR